MYKQKVFIIQINMHINGFQKVTKNISGIYH